MIEDEQVSAFINSFELNGGHFLGNNEFDNVRKALEAYEASKWIVPDIDDYSTLPKHFIPATVQYQNGIVAPDELVPHLTWKVAKDFDRVVRWQPLPEFKE